MRERFVPQRPAGRDANGTGAMPSGARTSVEATSDRAARPRGAARARRRLGFALQLATLDRMGDALARIEALDEGKRVALELEREVRSHYLHEASVAGEVLLVASPPRDERIARLAAELEGHVNDRDSRATVARIRATTRALEGLLEEARAAAQAGSASRPEHVQEDTYRLVSEIEDDVDGLVAHLQEADARECAAVARVRRSTQRIALVFLLAFPVLAIAVAARLSHSVARPLRVIGEGAARIAAGDLGTHVDAGGPEEFDVLASQVNAMAATLERNQQELVRAETLAGLGRMAAGIAHEINNPLQVMLGYLSLHRDRVGGALGRDLDRMEREATRCREIVGSLLQLARPALPLPAVPVDLGEVAAEVAGALRIAMGPRASSIRVAGEGAALGSPLAIRQILLNLARNAAEACGPAGEVEIRVAREGTRAAVSVVDTGPGVSAEHRSRVFDPFFTTKATGTGLGLPMARSLAGALGGDLALEPSEGGGARFTLRLPLAHTGGSTSDTGGST
jgi:two-component system NtrC family sensor kinase